MFRKSRISEEEYKRMFNNIQPELRILLLFTNLTCNARCNFCHIWGDSGWALNNPSEQSTEHLDYDRIKKFINESLEINKRPFWVMLTGGEPALYNSFGDLIAFLKSKKLPIILLTNGSKLVDQAELLVKNQVNTISISLDGPPKIHNNIRNIKGLYDKVCLGVEKIIELKQRRKSFFPLLFFNCVISEHTIDTMEDFLNNLDDEFRSKGINLKYNLDSLSDYNDVIIRFEPLLHTTKEQVEKYTSEMKKHFGVEVSSTPYSFIHDNSKIDVTSVKKFLEGKWNDSGIEVGELIEVDKYFGDIKYTFNHQRCFAPWHSLIVRANGDAYFCPDFKDYRIGNINESTFEEIWKGDRANKFRSVLDKGLLSLCNRCGGLYTDYHSLAKDMQ